MGALFLVGLATTTIAVFGCIVTGVGLWTAWCFGWLNRNLVGDRSESLLSRTPYEKPQWTLFECLLMFGLMLTFGGFFQSFAIRKANVEQGIVATEESANDTGRAASSEPDSEDAESNAVQDAKQPSSGLPLRTRLRIAFLANACALCGTFLWLVGILRLSPKQLGVIPSRTTIRQGLVATIWILTPVMLMNLIVVQFVKYEHSVIDLLSDENAFATYLSLMLSTALLTPIFEEVLFRGLLQGGLQRVADQDAYHAPGSTWSPRSIWPIALTSVLFALAHVGQGAAPIPLFLLSIGLGFLYQSSGSIIPCIIVHMLLNGTTLTMEYCRTNAELPI
ncbi:MAG: CPBP family intramembrane glutamic endopeptidase [Planctomycetota bacterium]